ncbi:MAG: hypothetical protein IPM56_00660 [Ignavibacteriales bacterium]|nr:MAG: hypothetical protein IPM56_00660 [Ignavibacteriales bacterium]
MKKMLLVLITVLCVAGFTSAQNKMYAGVGLNVALPMGSFGDVAGTGFGGTGTFEMQFTPQLLGTGTVGYISWGGKDFGFFSYSYSAIPILVGAKYYFMPNSGFYGHGQLGFYMFSIDVENKQPIAGFNFDTGGSSTEFAICFGAGYELPLSKTVMGDLGVSYNIISEAGHIGIRAGVKFGL